MAHLYGTIVGSRGMASRIGGKASGLRVRAASWEGAVTVMLYERDGKDYAHVCLATHNGAGVERELFDGLVSGKGKRSANLRR